MREDEYCGILLNHEPSEALAPLASVTLPLPVAAVGARLSAFDDDNSDLRDGVERVVGVDVRGGVKRGGERVGEKVGEKVGERMC